MRSASSPSGNKALHELTDMNCVPLVEWHEEGI